MSEENVEVVRRWWVALNKDGTPPLGLCDERIEIRNPASFPNRGPYRGHEGVHEWMVDAWEVIDEPHFEVDELIDVGDGETVVSVQRTTGRLRYSQLDAADVRWAAVWTIGGGRALRAQGYLTKAEALEAAGLSE
jgi:ketosteroid isomerase-like protein